MNPSDDNHDTTVSTPLDDTSIPLVNLCHFAPSRVDDYRQEIGRSCEEWGAFHVVNHDVPIQLLNDMRSIGFSFFNDLNISEKTKYACDPNMTATEGYGGTRMLADKNDDTASEWREYFDHHTFPLSQRNPSRWPDYPPNYRDIVEEYSNHMKVLAQKLLALISESLGGLSCCIEEAAGKFNQNITINYCPPCPQLELTLGMQSHSDMGVITLIIQDDVGSLQVMKDGEWVTVQPVSDAIVVLLADQTEIIANGAYKSAIYRSITNTKKAQLSVATYHDPAITKRISPAKLLLDDSSPPRYGQVVYGDYVKSGYTKGLEGKRTIDAHLL